MAAGAVAYACIDPQCYPAERSESQIHGFLQSEASKAPFETEKGGQAPLQPGELLDQLEHPGLLTRKTGLAFPRIAFAEDTIAEYLCAMYVADLGSEACAALTQKAAGGGDVAAPLQEALREVTDASSAATPAHPGPTR